jgi:hypothetical protein
VVSFEHGEGAQEGHVGLLGGVVLEEPVVLFKLDVALLLLVAEEPDGVLQLLRGFPHVPEVLLALLHDHLDLAELRHHPRLHLPAHLRAREGEHVDLAVDDPEQVLAQVVIDGVVLAVEGVEFPLVLVELALELLLYLALELVELLLDGRDDVVGQRLQVLLYQRNLLALVLELVLPALQAVERVLDLDQQHLLRLLLRLAGVLELADGVALVVGTALGAEVVGEALFAEEPAHLLVVGAAGGPVGLGSAVEVGVVGVGVLLALHYRYSC